jgi:hypothetical protein
LWPATVTVRVSVHTAWATPLASSSTTPLVPCCWCGRTRHRASSRCHRRRMGLTARGRDSAICAGRAAVRSLPSRVRSRQGDAREGTWLPALGIRYGPRICHSSVE